MIRPSRSVTHLVSFCTCALVLNVAWLARASPLPFACLSLPKFASCLPPLEHVVLRVRAHLRTMLLSLILVPGHNGPGYTDRAGCNTRCLAPSRFFSFQQKSARGVKKNHQKDNRLVAAALQSIDPELPAVGRLPEVGVTGTRNFHTKTVRP